jgi:hypothetical protein
VALAFPVVAAVLVGLLLGGKLSLVAELRLRAWWLFLVAIAIQVAAFPFAFLPWRTSGSWGTALWLASYALLVLAVTFNYRVKGVALVAAGMTANLFAIMANGGTMPVLPEAMRGAGGDYSRQANSTALADPTFPWLVDRWSAPEWIPLANVFSVGDVAIAGGAIVIVLAAMGIALPRPARLSPRS